MPVRVFPCEDVKEGGKIRDRHGEKLTVSRSRRKVEVLFGTPVFRDVLIERKLNMCDFRLNRS